MTTSAWSNDGHSIAGDIRAMVQRMRDQPWGPPPPVPHPLTQLRIIATDAELKEWQRVREEAAVSQRAQVVMAPDRVLICWPNSTVSEVWLYG